MFKKYSKLLKPTINFASIFTGGVDSSLQASYFFKEKKLKKLICVDHIKKDEITNKIVKFKEYTGKNITKIFMMKKYIIQNYQKFTKDYTYHFPLMMLLDTTWYINFLNLKELKSVLELLVRMNYLEDMKYIKILIGVVIKLKIYLLTLVLKTKNLIKIQKFLKHLICYGKRHSINIQNF